MFLGPPASEGGFFFEVHDAFFEAVDFPFVLREGFAERFEAGLCGGDVFAGGLGGGIVFGGFEGLFLCFLAEKAKGFTRFLNFGFREVRVLLLA